MVALNIYTYSVSLLLLYSGENSLSRYLVRMARLTGRKYGKNKPGELFLLVVFLKETPCSNGQQHAIKIVARPNKNLPPRKKQKRYRKLSKDLHERRTPGEVLPTRRSVPFFFMENYTPLESLSVSR